MNNRKRYTSTLSLAAALAAAGCGGGSGGDQMYAPPTPTPTPTPVAESFTSWSKSGVYAQPENASPIAMDALVFNFDGDENPNAYAELLPAS